MDAAYVLKTRFPRASQSCIDANLPSQSSELLRQVGQEKQDAGDHSKLERTTRDASLGKKETKRGDTARNAVRYEVAFVSVRKRLLDEDNLSCKAACDFLRYCGCLPNDNPEQTSIKVSQRKVAKGEKEHTEIVVYEITTN